MKSIVDCKRRFIGTVALFALFFAGCDSGENVDEPEPLQNEDETEGDRNKDTDSLSSGSDTESETAEGSSTAAVQENTLSLALSCDYVLDNAKTADGEYLEEHKTTIQVAPAFFGTIGDVVIPEAGAEGVHYEVFGLKRDESVIVLQMAFDEESQRPVNPFIQLTLDPAELAAGSAYALDPRDSLARGIIFNVKNDLVFDCVYGVFEGHINVKQAQKLEQSEGGILWLHGFELPVFPVENSNSGDLTGVFNAEDKQTCVQSGMETSL